jgi:hypothetical protein
MQTNEELADLARRACRGDKEAQYALEDAAEALLEAGKVAEAAAAFKEATAAFRIAAAYHEAHWRDAAQSANRLATKVELLRSWIAGRGTLEPLPRSDLPWLDPAEYARVLVRAQDPALGNIAALAEESLESRGIVFSSPGNSLQRWLGTLLQEMSAPAPTPRFAELLQDVQVRVALDLLADWAAHHEGVNSPDKGDPT